MEVGKGVKSEKIESKCFVYGGLKRKKEYEGCIRCLELYDKITKADAECAKLEVDNGKKNYVIESLEVKLGFMELKNLKVDNELRVLKQRNEELERSIQNRKGEDDKLTLLMIENKVLECEKKKAEIDLGAWKVKCKELETTVMELQKRLSAGMVKTGGPSAVPTQNKANEDKDASGNPTFNTPSKQHIDVNGFKGIRECELKSRAGNYLDFSGEGSPRNNISPSTPGIGPPFLPIEISDSDEDPNSREAQDPTGIGLGTNPDEKELTSKGRCGGPVVEDESDEENTTCYIVHPMPKRKKVKRGVAYVVTSESENDSDDNIPISRLRCKKSSACNSDARHNDEFANDSGSTGDRKRRTPKRRLKRVGETEDREISGKSSYKSSGNRKNLVTPDVMDDVSSEGESLGGFIVDSSDSSEGTSSGDRSGGSESSVAYDEVISGLRRERRNKKTWEYEGDMLADLSKCTELCMKGVCAIYRRQTSEEQFRQATILVNRRGFSQSHASIGSDLAEFLTDGDPYGDVTKTVEELQEFDPNGAEECRRLSTHYSRQLFEIYQNQEDPFFHP